ncbi:hypothetical protein L6R52_36375, partial [Myxococcota bacterium]|nr:hypothetical protein [Myxococcota bacterium]
MLDLAFEHAPVALAVAERDGVLVAANVAWRDLFAPWGAAAEAWVASGALASARRLGFVDHLARDGAAEARVV